MKIFIIIALVCLVQAKPSNSDDTKDETFVIDEPAEPAVQEPDVEPLQPIKIYPDPAIISIDPFIPPDIVIYHPADPIIRDQPGYPQPGPEFPDNNPEIIEDTSPEILNPPVLPLKPKPIYTILPIFPVIKIDEPVKPDIKEPEVTDEYPQVDPIKPQPDIFILPYPYPAMTVNEDEPTNPDIYEEPETSQVEPEASQVEPETPQVEPETAQVEPETPEIPKPKPAIFPYPIPILIRIKESIMPIKSIEIKPENPISLTPEQS